MASTEQQTRSTITVKGSVDIVLEYLSEYNNLSQLIGLVGPYFIVRALQTSFIFVKMIYKMFFLSFQRWEVNNMYVAYSLAYCQK